MEDKAMYLLIHGEKIPVGDLKMGHALTFLVPKEREIIMLYYFVCLKDEEIAKKLSMRRATVQRWRKKAEHKLRKLLESEP